MAAYNEKPRRSFSAMIQHRHSSATVLDFYSAVHNASSGTSTPPLQTSASVPFKWEQEPGKPRPGTHGPSRLKPGDGSSLLSPPPCMVQFVPYDTEPAGFTKLPPGSILNDGPHNLGRPKFSSTRFLRESQLDISLDRNNKGRGGGGGRGLFGKLKGSRRESEAGGNSGNSFSSSSGCESDDSCGRRIGRHGSYSNLSQDHHQTRSPHIWATIYGGFKHAVQWKGNSRK